MADFDPIESTRPFMASPRPEAFADDLLESDAADSESPSTLREGLPPGFRMRHDAHYVDQLTARSPDTVVRVVSIKDIDWHDVTAAQPPQYLVGSIQQFGILQPLLVRRRNGRYELIAGAKRLAAAAAAGLSEVPCLLHQADDVVARGMAEADNLHGPSAGGWGDTIGTVNPATVVGAELTRALSTVQSCLGLLPDQARPLRERLALELARAELQRASWLIGAQDVLTGEPSVVRRDLRASTLVEKVVHALGPERRLSAVQFVVEIADASLMVRADERLLTIAVAGMLDATLALVRRMEEGRIVVRLMGRAAPPSMVLDVSQDAVPLPAVARFLDPQWIDRPGGLTAGIGLAAAQRVAELHGGRLDVSAGDRSGSHLTLIVPSVS